MDQDIPEGYTVVFNGHQIVTLMDLALQAAADAASLYGFTDWRYKMMNLSDDERHILYVAVQAIANEVYYKREFYTPTTLVKYT